MNKNNILSPGINEIQGIEEASTSESEEGTVSVPALTPPVYRILICQLQDPRE